MVEKLKGQANAEFRLVDVYGLLLASRLLVPESGLEVNLRDFKLSNQRDYIRFGQNPLPIYTAVRHEISDLDMEAPRETGSASEKVKQKAKKEAQFQWFEITPYEFFCKEFSAGIPTWAMGRKFKNGSDMPAEEGFYLPEVRMPTLLGVFGSAYCATLSHYYREIRPLVQRLSSLQTMDELITGRNADLSKVHPIQPATLPNFCHGMEGKLPATTPLSIFKNEYLELMDAGMSNNLPIYPLLRQGREVDVIIAFDASADFKTDNWLSVADGYACQRGIKGWPVGIGYPKDTGPVGKVTDEFRRPKAVSMEEAERKLTEAKVQRTVQRLGDEGRCHGKSTQTVTTTSCKYDPAQPAHVSLTNTPSSPQSPQPTLRPGSEAADELGYCTVWVGSITGRTTENLPPSSKALDDTSHWLLSEPDAGLTIIYLPFLANLEKVPSVNPASSEYMSTWNFVYTPEQVDGVITLARANYREGSDRIKATVRAVYERKMRKRKMKEGRE